MTDTDTNTKTAPMIPSTDSLSTMVDVQEIPADLGIDWDNMFALPSDHDPMHQVRQAKAMRDFRKAEQRAETALEFSSHTGRLHYRKTIAAGLDRK